MNIYNSYTYMTDLENVINQSNLFSTLERKSIFITGATGLVCSGIIDLLLRYSELHGGCITVYAAGRNKEKLKRRFSRYKNASYLKLCNYDASKSNVFNFKADYVIHGASNAFPSAILAQPIDTMLDNFRGMHELLDYAKENNIQKTIFISSSEVYGTKVSMEPFKEEEYGFIDILNPRSSYSVGKRAAETLCACYVYEKGIPVSIVRPGHIYGPTANRLDNRVASAFAYNAAEGKSLILKSSGSQLRSYCYVLDCATAILTVLIYGKAATAYNISNPDSVISIKEIASLFSKYGKVELKFELANEIEKAAFNPMKNSSLNSQRLLSLGWRGLFDSEKGTDHTIKIIKETLCLEG